MNRVVILALACALLAVPAAAAPEVRGTYKGYVCTKDCSGHKAGYAWAAKKAITDIDDCRGKSNSFTEGCRSWVQEQAADMKQPATDETEDQEAEPVSE